MRSARAECEARQAVALSDARTSEGRRPLADARPRAGPGTSPSRSPLRAPRALQRAGGTMKKFSRMPKSEGGGGGGGAAGGGAGGAGAGSGSSSVGVRVFAVGRYQVTLEESLAEGTGDRGGLGRQVREGWGVAVASPGPRPLVSSPSRLTLTPSASSAGPAGAFRVARALACKSAFLAAGNSDLCTVLSVRVCHFQCFLTQRNK